MSDEGIQQENGKPSERSDYTTYITLMHLSTLLACLSGGLGAVVPIILWQLKADESPEINSHGRNIANFIISMFIYLAITWALCFFIVGFAFLPILIVFGVVCILIASMKASKGIYWKYPLSIIFFH